MDDDATSSRLNASLPLLGVALLLAAYWSLNPLRLEHVLVLVLLIALTAASRVTRDLTVALLPAAIFAFVYDLLRLFAERSYHEVVIEEVFHAEAMLFGWLAPEYGPLGPVEFFRQNHHIFLDFLAGLLYSTHVPSILVFGVFLWWQCWRGDGDRDQRVHPFMWGYLLFNVLGFAVWIIWPVAPPWYVEQYGFSPPGEAIPGDPAGLGRVDALLGVPHFQEIYARATYIFGAMPSLHVAPALWIALWARLRTIKWIGWIYTVMMSFFAVYLTHHYIIDVIAGLSLALSVYLLMAHTPARRIAGAASGAVRRWLDRLFDPR